MCHNRAGKREARDQAPIIPVFPKPYFVASFRVGQRNLGHLCHLLSRFWNDMRMSMPWNFCFKQFLPSPFPIRDFLSLFFFHTAHLLSYPWTQRHGLGGFLWENWGSKPPPAVLLFCFVLFVFFFCYFLGHTHSKWRFPG